MDSKLVYLFYCLDKVIYPPRDMIKLIIDLGKEIRKGEICLEPLLNTSMEAQRVRAKKLEVCVNCAICECNNKYLCIRTNPNTIIGGRYYKLQ